MSFDSATTNVSVSDLYELMVNGINRIESEIKSVKDFLTYKVEQQEIAVLKLQEDYANLSKLLESLKSDKKKNNLMIFGLQQTSESLIDNVVNLINKKVGVEIEKRDINNIFRVGKNRSDKRPVLVQFVTYVKKREVLLSAKNLKGTGIFINNDLSPQEREKQKVLRSHYHLARSMHHNVRITDNSLIVNGDVFTAEQLAEQPSQEAFNLSKDTVDIVNKQEVRHDIRDNLSELPATIDFSGVKKADLPVSKNFAKTISSDVPQRGKTSTPKSLVTTVTSDTVKPKPAAPKTKKVLRSNSQSSTKSDR